MSDDSALIARCLAGDEEAWRLFYAQYQPFLLGVVRSCMRPRWPDSNLHDEIVQRVWCSLVDQDYKRLRAFDLKHGTLPNYLAGLTRNQVRWVIRGIVRAREDCSLVSAVLDSLPAAEADSGSFLLGELETWLTAAERTFLRRQMGDDAANAQQRALSPAYQRRLARRVKRKLLGFLAFGDFRPPGERLP